MPAGPDLVDDVQGQGFRVDGNALHIMLDRIDDVVDEDHKFRGCHGAVVHPAAAVVAQPGADGRGRKALKCRFGAGLGVAEFGIGGTGRPEERDLVVLGHLGQGAGHQAHLIGAV